MAKKRKKAAKKKQGRKKKSGASKKGSPTPVIRSPKDLIKHISILAEEFTGEHKGAEAVLGGSPMVDSYVPFHIPTGCPNFDAMMGGGFPAGRMVQMFGPESSGKSTLLYSGFVQCQKMGGVCVLLDPEASFDAVRFRLMGGDPDGVIVLQTAYGGKRRTGGGKSKKSKQKAAKEQGLPVLTVEDVFKYIYDILDSIACKPEWQGHPVIVGLDSLDNITTDAAIFGDPRGMTDKPREIRQGLRKITSPIAKSNACFVVISQTIENIGGYGPKTRTAGGGGPKFISSIRVKTKRAYFGDVDRYQQDSDGNRTGQALIEAEVIKNKLNRPYLKAVTAINNDSKIGPHGVDVPYSLLYGLFDDIVKTTGSHRYVVIDDKLPGVADVVAKHGIKPGQHHFYLSQWRDFVEKTPGILEVLRVLSARKFPEPAMVEITDAEEDDGQSEETGHDG